MSQAAALREEAGGEGVDVFLEPLFAVLCWFLISVGVPIYLEYFAVDFERDGPFERWCGRGPVILALYAKEGQETKVWQALQGFAEEGPIQNPSGARPWPLYHYQLACQPLSGQVMVVRLDGCKPNRGRQWPGKRLAALLGTLTRGGDSPLECYWLLSSFTDLVHPMAETSPRAGWLALPDGQGGFQFQPTMGPPGWMRALGPAPLRKAGRG